MEKYIILSYMQAMFQKLFLKIYLSINNLIRDKQKYSALEMLSARTST